MLIPDAPLTPPRPVVLASPTPSGFNAVMDAVAALRPHLEAAEPGRYADTTLQRLAPATALLAVRRACVFLGAELADDGTGHVLWHPAGIREGRDAAVLRRGRVVLGSSPVTVRLLCRAARGRWISAWWMRGWAERMVAGGLLEPWPAASGPRRAPVTVWRFTDVASE